MLKDFETHAKQTNDTIASTAPTTQVGKGQRQDHSEIPQGKPAAEWSPLRGTSRSRPKAG